MRLPPPVRMMFWSRSVTLSEEGGRFYHNQNRYVAIEVGDDVEASENHKWVSHPQLLELIRRGWVNIEGRTIVVGTNLAMEGAR